MRFMYNGIDCSPGRSRLHLGWRKQRGVWIKEFYWCAACGYIPKRGSNDVHHCIPRHVAPWLADQLFNFMTLCEKNRCHLGEGHFWNFRQYWNPNIEDILQDKGKELMEARIDFIKNIKQEEAKWKEAA